jgi:glycosyltransferase involved in cell wall biosynthesis
MKVAYLINQYPKVSHTFVRREIAALQADGIQILRYSIRRFPEPLVDPLDQAEALQTHVLLAGPKWRMLATVAAAALIRPIHFLRALRTTLRMARRSDRGLIRHLAYLTEACLLHRRLARHGIGHVHAHFGTNSATVALLTRELGSVSFSFTAHGPEEFDQAVQWSLGEKIEKAAFVIGVSHFGRSQLCRQCDYQFWKKIHVVHCGVDGDYLDPDATAVPHTRKLVSIGRLSEQKGQMLLLEALGRLRQQNLRIELDLIGDGEFRPQIERAIAEHGLDDSVRITGWADGDTIRCALDECSAFVLPSFAEGLPVVIMEAMARARPVLSTYVAGIPELVRPGKNGWLVPAGSVEDLANVLREVVTTPFETLTAMGQNGRARVAEQYDSRRIGRQLSVLMRSTQPMQNRPKQSHNLSYEGIEKPYMVHCMKGGYEKF